MEKYFTPACNSVKGIKGSNKLWEFLLKMLHTKAVKHSLSASSILNTCSYLVFSLLVLFPVFFSLAFLFSPLCSFLSSFWPNKLVSLMSSDTSRSQSQLPDNNMAVTFWLSTICMCLFQFPLLSCLRKKRTPTLCCFSQEIVSDVFGLRFWTPQLFAADNNQSKSTWKPLGDNTATASQRLDLVLDLDLVFPNVYP